jgi:hypothetical protein
MFKPKGSSSGDYSVIKSIKKLNCLVNMDHIIAKGKTEVKMRGTGWERYHEEGRRYVGANREREGWLLDNPHDSETVKGRSSDLFSTSC